MRKIIETLFISSILWLGNAYATDASPVLTIKLKPRAVNADKVLFSILKYENTTAAVKPCIDQVFGWLVVSASGIWDERKSFTHHCNNKDEKEYNQYLKGEYNLQNPDDELKNLMKKYGLWASNTLEKEPYVYAIKSHQSCFKGACIERSTKQLTLGKITSTKLASPIRSSFYYKGVALFHNVHEKHIPNYPEPSIAKSTHLGASFDFKKNGEPFKTSYIDGLVLFDDYKRFHQPNEITKNKVENIVKKMFHLFHTKNIRDFNKRFIHPKYGFYNIYRPGAMDRFEHHLQLEEIIGKGWSKESYLFSGDEIEEPIKWETVSYNCDSATWNKKGVFIHESPYIQVKEIMSFLEKYESQHFTKSFKEQAKFLEKDLFVVVDTEHDITFHIKLINNKWFLTHIDRTVSDCSA